MKIDFTKSFWNFLNKIRTLVKNKNNQCNYKEIQEKIKLSKKNFGVLGVNIPRYSQIIEIKRRYTMSNNDIPYL